ncbi:integrase arm-type DNA-binding domain-containing protein [Massilia sp. Root335]|uniref:tyrosine-type recombinase/integrase n=1 Tax=Massilia sp. Root335 TaxID=1736517 RepID=UPI0006F52075|nr:integrase arm-type DNA-binding domain-containing protein [Massilia sp. Root335]
MPKQVQPLTQLQVCNAKAKGKPCKLADGGGLYLEVMPTGGKLWRMKFRQPDGKENRLSFGALQDVSLADARAKRDEARRLLAAGADPAQAKAEQARQARLSAQNTFEHVARDWHRTMIKKWQPRTAEEILRRFEAYIFPAFGQSPIAEIQAPDVLDDIRAIERRGALEIANRQTANCSGVFRYAIRCGLAERNPAEFLREVLEPREKGHFAAIGVDELPEFLRAPYANEACMGVSTRIAMKLMLLVFVRTSELIETPSAEVDVEKGEWIIPWKRMKRGQRRINPDKTDHHVCLSRQALALLCDLHRHTGAAPVCSRTRAIRGVH